MKARIKSIKLIEKEENVYWQITLSDEDENIIGVFGDEDYRSDIDFRNQTFYLMKILNNWDLLKLDGIEKKYPILVDATLSRIKSIANEKGDHFTIDGETGEITIEPGYNTKGLEPRVLSSLLSASGCLCVGVETNYSYQRMNSSGNVYCGFQPIYRKYVPKEKEEYGAKSFKIFVQGILKICGIDELIESERGPVVTIETDENGIITAIGNEEGTEFITISESGYSLCTDVSKIEQTHHKR